MLLREGGEGQDVGSGLGQEVGGVGELLGQVLDDPGVLGPDVFGVGLGEDRTRQVATMAWADFGTG